MSMRLIACRSLTWPQPVKLTFARRLAMLRLPVIVMTDRFLIEKQGALASGSAGDEFGRTESSLIATVSGAAGSLR